MGFLRALLVFLTGVLIGVVSVGAFTALPFPFSEIPVFPILISLSLVLRARTSTFWMLLTAVGISDLYRGSGFGIGILSFACIIVIGVRLSSDLVTHRSLIGCAVISLFTGLFWTFFISIFSGIQQWWRVGNSGISLSTTLLSGVIQAGVTMVVCVVLYELIPLWWRSRSPAVLGNRHL